jgi:hypothetical protein
MARAGFGPPSEAEHMVSVKALQSFNHDGPIDRGQEFEVSAEAAKALRRAKLVSIEGDGCVDPLPAAGTALLSSALPAAQVLTQTTSKRSRSGASKKQLQMQVDPPEGSLL